MPGHGGRASRPRAWPKRSWRKGTSSKRSSSTRISISARAVRVPASIGGVAVTSIDDFEHGFASFGANDILRFWTADGSRVVVRPSGTEPKVKVYIDASSTEGTAASRVAAAEAKVAVLDAGMRELLK